MNVFYYPCSGDGDTQCFEWLRVQIHLLWSWFTYIIWHFTCILSLHFSLLFPVLNKKCTWWHLTHSYSLSSVLQSSCNHDSAVPLTQVPSFLSTLLRDSLMKFIFQRIKKLHLKGYFVTLNCMSFKKCGRLSLSVCSF